MTVGIKKIILMREENLYQLDLSTVQVQILN